MAKKVITKESLHEMSAKELQARLSEIQENYFRMRFRHASHPLKNPMEIRLGRREIARIKTVLCEKEKGSV